MQILQNIDLIFKTRSRPGSGPAEKKKAEPPDAIPPL